MKKLGITLAMLLASTALASANMLVTARECIGAVCGPQFIFTDPGNTISVNQPVGDFTVVITGTQDNPPGVGGIMLSGTDISIRDNTGVAGTITVTVTGQGYTTTVPAFESSFTQNLITGSAMTMQTFTDFANNIGGTQLSTFIPPTIPNINGNQIFTETRLAPQGLGNNYSLTDLFSFTASGASDQTTATINIAAVPGPIVGAGLPGLVAACGGLLALARRRRQLVV